MDNWHKNIFYLSSVFVLTIACWFFTGILYGARSQTISALLFTGLVLLPLALALALAARELNPRFWIAAGFLLFLGMFLPVTLSVDISYPVNLPSLLISVLVLIPALTIAAALVVAALLLEFGLRVLREGYNPFVKRSEIALLNRKQSVRPTLVLLGLCVLLIGKSLYNLYWLTVWDNTTDSIGYLWVLIPAWAALICGFLMTISLHRRWKWAGLYGLILPALMIVVSGQAQQVDYRQLTEERASHVNLAIESYYARKGYYPQSLSQLIPWYALSLSGPVIIYGQHWCYDGGDEYYRLGYVTRKHWSDPNFTSIVYAQGGDVSKLPPACEAEISAIRKGFSN